MNPKAQGDQEGGIKARNGEVPLPGKAQGECLLLSCQTRSELRRLGLRFPHPPCLANSFSAFKTQPKCPCSGKHPKKPLPGQTNTQVPLSAPPALRLRLQINKKNRRLLSSHSAPGSVLEAPQLTPYWILSASLSGGTVTSSMSPGSSIVELSTVSRVADSEAVSSGQRSFWPSVPPV